MAPRQFIQTTFRTISKNPTFVRNVLCTNCRAPPIHVLLGAQFKVKSTLYLLFFHGLFNLLEGIKISKLFFILSRRLRSTTLCGFMMSLGINL